MYLYLTLRPQTCALNFITHLLKRCPAWPYLCNSFSMYPYSVGLVSSDLLSPHLSTEVLCVQGVQSVLARPAGCLRDTEGSSVGTGETWKLYFGAPAELFLWRLDILQNQGRTCIEFGVRSSVGLYFSWLGAQAPEAESQVLHNKNIIDGYQWVCLQK